MKKHLPSTGGNRVAGTLENKGGRWIEGQSSMWESCKVGRLKKNKECYVFNDF